MVSSRHRSVVRHESKRYHGRDTVCIMLLVTSRPTEGPSDVAAPHAEWVGGYLRYADSRPHVRMRSVLYLPELTSATSTYDEIAAPRHT